MAAIEVLIYIAIAGSGYSCIVLLRESVGRHGKHDVPDVLALGLK